jgi:hypothetical protein
MAGKVRSRAAQAAKELLDARVSQVEALDAAISKQRDAEAAVELAARAASDAAEDAQRVYAEARRAGWTDSELEQLGYAEARPPRSGPRTRGERKRVSSTLATADGSTPELPSAGRDHSLTESAPAVASETAS